MVSTPTTTDAKLGKPGRSAVENFKASAEVENFYRFINDNGLRREAYMMFDYLFDKISVKKKSKRKTRSPKKSKKVQ